MIYLSKHPIEKCLNPYFSFIISHWVPFPDPGPPRTKKILVFVVSNV